MEILVKTKQVTSEYKKTPILFRIFGVNLPTSLHEMGLVNGGISDVGGIELLDWMKKSTSLKMVCIEQNNFSEKFRIQLNQFRTDNPQILFVF